MKRMNLVASVAFAFVAQGCGAPEPGAEGLEDVGSLESELSTAATPNLHQINTWYCCQATQNGVTYDKYWVRVKNYGGATGTFTYWFDVNGYWNSGYYTQTRVIGTGGVVDFYCLVARGRQVSTVEMSGREAGYYIAPDDITPWW